MYVNNHPGNPKFLKMEKVVAQQSFEYTGVLFQIVTKLKQISTKSIKSFETNL
jgi:hypothetical protein